jgi:Flp pilus assembly protein TadB
MSKESRNRSDQAREVAEIFISNSADHSSQSLTRHNTINTMPNYFHDSLYHNEDYLRETLAAGSPRDGRISAVRRFFCLFVTFDFLFTTLMWIICLVVIRNNFDLLLPFLLLFMA